MKSDRLPSSGWTSNVLIFCEPSTAPLVPILPFHTLPYFPGQQLRTSRDLFFFGGLLQFMILFNGGRSLARHNIHVSTRPSSRVEVIKFAPLRIALQQLMYITHPPSRH